MTIDQLCLRPLSTWFYLCDNNLTASDIISAILEAIYALALAPLSVWHLPSQVSGRQQWQSQRPSGMIGLLSHPQSHSIFDDSITIYVRVPYSYHLLLFVTIYQKHGTVLYYQRLTYINLPKVQTGVPAFGLKDIKLGTMLPYYILTLKGAISHLD